MGLVPWAGSYAMWTNGLHTQQVLALSAHSPNDIPVVFLI